MSAAIPPSAIKPDPFNLNKVHGLPSSQSPSTTPAGIPPGWPSLSGSKNEADIKKEKLRSELEENERREKQREREKRQQRSSEVRPPPTGPDGTLPQYLATMGVKSEVLLGDRKRDVSRSPVRSLPSGSPGARSNTSSIAPSDVRSIESASVSPMVKRETAVPNDSRPLSASNNSRDKAGSGSIRGSSDTIQQNSLVSNLHSVSGLTSRSTSANDLSSSVKKEDNNEITVIGEKEGIPNGRAGRNSLNNHTGKDHHHHHSTSIHSGQIKTDSSSRQHSSSSLLSSASSAAGAIKQDSRRPLSNPSRDTNSVKPSSLSQSTSLASSLATMQQHAAMVSAASSLTSGIPYPSIPGLPPPGYPPSDPRTAAALGLFPGLNGRAGAATPLPPAAGFGAHGLMHHALDPFRDPYLAAAAAASNPYFKDPLREAREREMLRMNPLGSMIMSEHDRARMALAYPAGAFPPSAGHPAAAGLYGMSAAHIAAGAASKIPPPPAGAALGAPHLGMYSAGLGSLAGLGAAAAGLPGLTPPLTPTVNGHAGASSTTTSNPLAR